MPALNRDLPISMTLRTLILCFLGPVCAYSAGGDFDLIATLKGLSSSSPTDLTIPAGIYRLPAGGVRLEKVKNLHIHAAGVTWVATDLTTTALQLEKCENVTIDGLTIDYDPLPFTQGTVVALDRKAMTADFEVHAGYPELSDALLKERQLHLFEKDAPRWKPGAPDYYPKLIERLSARKGRITFQSKVEGFDLVHEGSRVALTIRKKNALKVGFGCKGLVFENVTIHAAPGIGILVRFAEEAGTFRHVRVIPGPKPVDATEERLMSTSADAFNAAYCRQGPVIEDCEFSYMGDDGINLHGVMLPVLQQRDERTLVAMALHRGEPFDRMIRAGDDVRLLEEPDYAITATAVVESITPTQMDSADWKENAKKIWRTFEESATPSFFLIRLKAPMTGVSIGDFVEVPALGTPQFSIRNSSFHDHRARGLRLMASNGIIENNRFERLRGPGITIGGEFAFWREAGWCRNVTVRGNRITSVCEGLNSLQSSNYTTGAISIFARVLPDGAATRYFQGHESIDISGNQIDGCPVNGIQVVAAQKVTVTGNTLKRVNQQKAPKIGADYGLQVQQPIVVIQAEAETKDNVTDSK